MTALVINEQPWSRTGFSGYDTVSMGERLNMSNNREKVFVCGIRVGGCQLESGCVTGDG